MPNNCKEISKKRVFILSACFLQIFLYIFRKNPFLQILKDFLLLQINLIIEVNSLKEFMQNVVFPILFIVDVYISELKRENINTHNSRINAVRNGNHNIAHEDESRQLNAHNDRLESARNNEKIKGKNLTQNYDKLNI